MSVSLVELPTFLIATNAIAIERVKVINKTKSDVKISQNGVIHTSTPSQDCMMQL